MLPNQFTNRQIIHNESYFIEFIIIHEYQYSQRCCLKEYEQKLNLSVLNVIYIFILT